MKKMIAIALVLMLCIGVLSVNAFAASTVTVTAEVPADWTTAYCYSWVNGVGNPNWPGVEMTKSGNVWTAEIPADCDRVIITASNSGPQTVDLTIAPGKDVTLVLGTKSGDKFTATVTQDGVQQQPAPTPSGYYVTGSDVFGNWAELNEAGKMTEQNGVYVKEFTGVAAGDYKLKVNTGSWSQSWGKDGQDYEFNVAEANSTVTVTFDPATTIVTVSVNGSNVGGGESALAPTFDAYYVAGTGALCNGKEWDAGAAENVMTKGDDGIWSITYTNVSAGDYEVKVTAGNWDNSWGLNGENVKFSIEEAGDITVRFNPNTGWVSVYHNGNPLTGDMNLAGISLALLAATAGLVALVGKKKEF